MQSTKDPEETHHVGRFIGELGKDYSAAEPITEILDGLRLCLASDAKAPNR